MRVNKKFAGATAGVAVIVALAFFAACATGGGVPVVMGPIAPTDINPVVFDNFNHNFSSPLNGHNGQWGDNAIMGTGLGYWFGGVSSESMVLAEPFHGVTHRVATFGLAAAANSWGRAFQNTHGTPTPLGAPAAIGVRFIAREDNETFVGVTWAVYIHAGRGAGGPSASLYFSISEVGEWQEFFVEFPAGFQGDWITGYDVWMRTFPPAAMTPASAAAMSVAQMVFVYADAADAE